MKLDNRTVYNSDDLRRVIQLICRYDGFVPLDGAIVRIVHSRQNRFSGYAYYGGGNGRNGCAMLLRLPRPKHGLLSIAKTVHLIRHEVAHWRNLQHTDMGDAYMIFPKDGDPLPQWAESIGVERIGTIGIVVPVKFAPVDRSTLRESHARAMLAEHEAKLRRQKTLVAKWQKKVRYYDNKTKVAAPVVLKAASDDRSE